MAQPLPSGSEGESRTMLIRKKRGWRTVLLLPTCAAFFLMASPSTQAQSRTVRVLETVGAGLEQLGRDMESSAMAEQAVEEQRRQERARQAEKARQDAMSDEAMLASARQDPALNPFAHTPKTVQEPPRQGVGGRSPNTSTTGPAQRATSSAAPGGSQPSGSQVPQLACTEVAVEAYIMSLMGQVPNGDNMCLIGRAGKQIFGDILQATKHCPDTGAWAAYKQEWLQQQQAGQNLAEQYCG